MNEEPKRLILADHQLAYQQQRSQTRGKTGILFLSGFASDMSGSKASFLAERCAEADIDYLRFDYRAHGLSAGVFTDCTIGDWFQDALAVFDRLTEGPQILVGSSMGGWIALLLAVHRPERVAGIVGIAAAPDFTEELIWNVLTEDQKRDFQLKGILEIPTSADDLPITYKLVEEGRAHCLLAKPISIRVPVHLVQGLLDKEVPWQYPLRIAEQLETEDVKVTMVKGGDHRLSRPEDLSLVWDVLKAMLAKA